MGFIWDMKKHQWEEGFKNLVAYKKEFGDCLVKAKSQYQGYGLGSWVGNQRSKLDQLTTEQVGRLDNIGFVFDVTAHQWDLGFGYLVAYKKEFGDCFVKSTFQYQNYSLGPWVSHQRNKKDKLTPEQFNSLNKIGFIWDPFESNWDRGFGFLASYYKEFGTCLIATNTLYQEYKLGQWVNVQRTKKAEMKTKRIALLNGLDFIWDAREYEWERRFSLLVAYKAKFGDCLVKNLSKNNDELETWVSIQRSQKAKLTPERLDRLNKLGFVWKVK